MIRCGLRLLEGECVKLNPRETMEWSADIVFDPTFDRWNEKIDGRKSSGSNK